jgi:hypothetical protein
VLGDRPAIHPRQPGQQSQHEQPDPPTRRDPDEPARDPLHQFVEIRLRSIRVHAWARGHRQTILCPHISESSNGGRATSGTATPPDHELLLEY